MTYPTVNSNEGLSIFASSSEELSKSMSLQTLLKRGSSPTLNSINNFFIYLSDSRRFGFIVHFFYQLKSNKVPVNCETSSIVAWSLLKLQKFDEAEEFIHTQSSISSFVPKNRVLDSLIQGFCIERDNPDKALSILRDLLNNQCAFPSSFTFCSLIHRFIARGNMEKAIEVLEMMTNERVNYPFDNFVCSAVISGFCRIGKPELALGFFENVLSSGVLRPNVVTYTAAVSALCKLGRVSEVSDLVRRMEIEGIAFDVVFYSNWICGYIREGELMTAFREHRKMVDRQINPDTASYTILIDGFSKEGDVEKALGFLGRMVKDGVKPNLVTYTAIARGFCKKGKLDEAFALFQKVLDMGIEVDEFMYATLIDGVCRNGDLDRVFCMLAEMEREGIKPSIVTYNTVINGLCKIRRTSEADKVSEGFQGDIFTYSTLLFGYTEEENTKGLLKTKQRFEEAGIHMDLIMFNILLKALFMMGAFEDAYALYKEMPDMNLNADSATYHTMIEGYCRAGRIDEALEVFNEFRETEVSSLACYNIIINELCRTGMLDTAIEVFIELCETGMPCDPRICRILFDAIFGVGGDEGVLDLVYGLESMRSDIYSVICNEALRFLCKRGSSDAASKVYFLMKTKGSDTTSKSYYSLLMRLSNDENFSLTWPLLSLYIKEFGLVNRMVVKMLLHVLCLKDVDKALTFLRNPWVQDFGITFSSDVLKMLVKDGKAMDAYELVMGAENSLPSLDVVDYSMVIDGLCKQGYLVQALDLCKVAEHKGIAFNIITYNSVINGLCQQGSIVEAFRLFDSLEGIGLVPSEITYATLIDSLCKEGFLEDAKNLFDRMVVKIFEPNIHVYNSMIYGYCKLGQVANALKLLSDLEKKGATPGGFSISSVIYGYCLKGDMEGALSFFVEFKKKSILPDLLGYLYLMKGFCTKGRMEEARSILREMLQSESVLELISKVDSEVESESIKSFLVELCEQGSIIQAVTILEEIGSMFFSASRRLSTHHGLETSSRTNQQYSVRDMNGEEILVEKCDGTRKRSCLSDFDRFYPVISSLCSKGELQEADRLVKAFFSDRVG